VSVLLLLLLPLPGARHAFCLHNPCRYDIPNVLCRFPLAAIDAYLALLARHVDPPHMLLLENLLYGNTPIIFRRCPHRHRRLPRLAGASHGLVRWQSASAVAVSARRIALLSPFCSLYDHHNCRFSYSVPADIDAYHALLARHMDLSDDSEYDYDSDDEATSHVAESAPVPQWSQQQQEEEPADQQGWQAVGVKGKAPPPAVSPPAGAASSSRAQEPGEDPAELQRREEELLRAAIQVGAACGSGCGSAVLTVAVLWASPYHRLCVCLGRCWRGWVIRSCGVLTRVCCL
jgi:hypothetical protein